MRFTALPVHSFEDATLDLEQLQALLTTPSGQSLPFLQLLTVQNVQVAFGTGAATWAASTLSGIVTITHGLTRAPVVAIAASVAGSGVAYSAQARAVSTVKFQGWTTSAGTFPDTFCWLALG